MAIMCMNYHARAAPERNPLSWRMRIQIAIDVANALVIAPSHSLSPLIEQFLDSRRFFLLHPAFPLVHDLTSYICRSTSIFIVILHCAIEI